MDSGLFHQLFDDLSLGVVWLNARREIEAVNPAYRNLMGAEPLSLEMCPHLHQCQSYFDPSQDLCCQACPFDHSEAFSARASWVSIRGFEPRPMKQAYSRLTNEHGELTGVLMFLTPEDEFHEHLSRKNRELFCLNCEINQAASVHKQLSRCRREQLPGWETALLTVSYRTLGGDLAESLWQGDRGILYLADISGKSVPAAMLVPEISRVCHTELHDEPLTGIAKLNKNLHQLLPQGMFVAGCFFFVYPAGRIICINAGLDSPVLYRGQQAAAQSLRCLGCILGIEEEICGTSITLDLQPGDTLVAWTDGVDEAMDRAGENPLALVATWACSAKGNLEESITHWLRKAHLDDDATVVAIRRNP